MNKAKIDDEGNIVDRLSGEVLITAGELVADNDVMSLVCKLAAFDRAILFAVVNVCTPDAPYIVGESLQWECADVPWWTVWSGKGRPFEAIRRVVASCADDAAQVLIRDLTAERDKLFAEVANLRRATQPSIHNLTFLGE